MTAPPGASPGSDAQPPLLEAATVMVVRPIFPGDAEGPFELLIMDRSPGHRFAGGVWAFPGGRVDPGDEGPGIDRQKAAALRELLEETGLFAPDVDPAQWPALRASWNADRNQGFARFLASIGGPSLLDALRPFCRWTPPPDIPVRRYRTSFFWLGVPAGVGEAKPDGREALDLFWATPQRVLDAAAEGRGRLLFPTRRNLERLAGLRTVKALAAERFCPEIQPRIEKRADGAWLVIPSGQGYATTEEQLDMG